MHTTFAMIVGLISVGQLPSGDTPRVAVDRNNQYVDITYSDSATGMLAWRRNWGTPTYFATGSVPSNDVDDNGNSAVVWVAPDPTNSNISTIYLRINSGSAIKVDVGAYARVAMGRTNGKLAVAYIDPNGAVIGGHGINATTIQVKTYDLSGTCTSGPTQVNTTYASYTSNCAFGGISAAEDGDYVVAFYRLNGPSGTTGVYVRGYLAGSSTAKFGETQIYSTLSSTAAYYDAEISCFSNGASVVAFTVPTSSGGAGKPFYVTQVSSTGSVVTTDTILNSSSSYGIIGEKAGSSGVGILPFSIAAKRNSANSNDYFVIWQSNRNSYWSSWDLFYHKVHNGSVPGTPTNATNGAGGYSPDAFSTPCAAIADTSSGGNDTIFVFKQYLNSSPGWKINYTMLPF